MRSFISFFALGLLSIACQTGTQNGQSDAENDKVPNTVESSPPIENQETFNLNEYASSNYDFKFTYPETWKVVKDTLAEQFPVINIYHQQYEDLLKEPVKIHAYPSAGFISILPKGYPTELPAGKSVTLTKTTVPLDLTFNLNQQESKLFKMENGEIWGYFLVPSEPPSSWHSNGYVFAQISAENYSIACYDEATGEQISMEACDPMTGDRIAKTGIIDEQSSTAIKAILQSFEFTSGKNEKKNVTELIKIEEPSPDQVISSPLEIKGKARGMWYFEGDFPVELVDNNGNQLAEGIASAQGKWMTEDFVPFEATIKYDKPTVETGYLIFHRDNPSGLPENAMERRLPVKFESQ